MLSQFVTEVQQMLFGQAPFEKRARIHARSGVPLEVNQIAGLVSIARVKKVIETDFAQGGERGICRDVTANVRVVFVLTHHHRRGIPANQTLDPALHGAIAWIGHFVARRNRVHVGAHHRQLRSRTDAASAL